MIFDVSYFDFIFEVREQPGDPCEGAEEGWRPGGKAQSGGQPVLQNTKYKIQNMHTKYKICSQNTKYVHKIQNMYTVCKLCTQNTKCVQKIQNMYTKHKIQKI